MFFALDSAVYAHRRGVNDECSWWPAAGQQKDHKAALRSVSTVSDYQSVSWKLYGPVFRIQYSSQYGTERLSHVAET